MKRWLTSRKTTIPAIVIALLAGLSLVAPSAAQAETTSIICSGSAACKQMGLSDHSWPEHINEGRWDTYPGHNCTGYAAYALEVLNGATYPGKPLGDGKSWDESAKAAGVSVNKTPGLGSIAQWDADQGMGDSGHVAYVEKITSTYVDVSEDVYSNGPFSYRRVYKPSTGWTIDFLHFKDRVTAKPAQLSNGGFESGTAKWVAGDINFTTYATSGVTKPAQGSRFGAINNPSGGGVLRQDSLGTVPVNASYCVSARVTTVGTGSGGNGEMVLWFIGGTRNESSIVHYTGLAGNNKWTLIRSCATATVDHAGIRVEFRPTAGAPTTGIDGVSINGNYAKNGGFNNGGTSWGVTGSANFATYTDTPYEGSRYAAANASKNGDSVRQDIKLNPKGKTVCMDVMLRGGPRTSVDVLIAGIGTSATEKAVKTVPLGSAWGNLNVCKAIVNSHTTVRAELFPKAGAGTISADAVNVYTR